VADTSLIFSIIARDRTSSTLDRIRRNASSTGSIAARALGPAVGPVVASSTAAIIGMGAALAGAGVAAGVFGGVVATSMVQVTETAGKMEDLQDKIKLLGEQARIMAARGQDNSAMLEKQAKAALELEARLSMLPAAQQDAVRGYMDMKSAWEGFTEHNNPTTFAFLARGYNLIKQGISQLQPFFDMGAAAANRLLDAVSPLITGGGLSRFAAVSGPALASLTQIIINVGKAIGGMGGKFVGTGQGVLDWIEEATRKWAEWSTATGSGEGINKFVSYVQTNGPRAFELLSSLASAAKNIAAAVAPLAPISLAVATALATLIAVIPPEVLTTLVGGWIAFNIALKAWAVGSAIATAAQWAQNAAFLASPITWIILAIIALVAVIYLVATRTKFFQTVWNAVWGFMKSVGAWFAGPFAAFFVNMWARIVASLNRARSQFMSGVNAVKGFLSGLANTATSIANRIVAGFNRVISFFRAAPGRIRGALSNMFSGLWSGFRSAVNNIIGGWNRLSFGIPGFSFAGMSFGGFNVGTPNIPYLDRGAGMVQREGLAFIHRGESVTPAARVTPYRSTNRGEGATLTIRGDGSKTANFLLELLRQAIRDKGGDPVKVLTAR
jgi:hypothetical protein